MVQTARLAWGSIPAVGSSKMRIWRERSQKSVTLFEPSGISGVSLGGVLSACEDVNYSTARQCPSSRRNFQMTLLLRKKFFGVAAGHPLLSPILCACKYFTCVTSFLSPRLTYPREVCIPRENMFLFSLYPESTHLRTADHCVCHGQFPLHSA